MKIKESTKFIKNLAKHLWRNLFLFVSGVCLLLFWYFFVGIGSNLAGSSFNKAHNAVWLSHDWVGEEKSAAEIQNLVDILTAKQIDTVFLHAGPLKEDGGIDPQTYRYAIDFLEQARRFNPEIRYQAWLGQLRNKLDLEDAEVRKNVLNQVVVLTKLVGFDGIHFDIEPVWDYDQGFVLLLEQSQKAMSGSKKISVALAEFIPGSVLWFFEKIHQFELYNSETNFLNVEKYADQIVVMAYDTSIRRDWLYRWLVSEQVVWVSRLIKNKEFFIGLPAYDKPTKAFDPQVENLENGLRGAIRGLNNLRSNEASFAGVAIYPYWLIDEEEWQVYDDLWLKK